MTLPAPLAPTAAIALRLLLDGGPATRPLLAGRLGVTKQTVSAAVVELEERGLVEAVEARQGATGRSALLYALHRRAGWVAGIDLGSDRVRVAAARLDGTPLGQRAVSNPFPRLTREWPDQLRTAAHLLARLVRETTETEGGLLGTAIAVPRAVPLVEDLLADGAREPDLRLLEALAPVAPAAIWLENDVNCEALAQLRSPGEVPESVLHLHVGAGVGAALVLDGRIVRGARGRAGEVRALRVPTGRSRTAEQALGTAGLLAAAGHSIEASPVDALDDLFAAAATGDAAAEAAIDAETGGIIALLAELTAVLDPALVVLSGAVGSRPELRDRVAAGCRAAGVEAPVEADPFGEAAAATGAAALARELVVAALAPR